MDSGFNPRDRRPPPASKPAAKTAADTSDSDARRKASDSKNDRATPHQTPPTAETFGFGKGLEAGAPASAPGKSSVQLGDGNRVTQEKMATQLEDDLHIWVNGRPHVPKMAKKELSAVVQHGVQKTRTAAEKENPAVAEKPAEDAAASSTASTTDLGESNTVVESEDAETEGIDSMRAMKLVVKHVQDSSQSLDDQDMVPSEAEYSFSIKNTNAHDQSMGIAKNIHLDASLPKAAKLKDAYFYLEATDPHEEPKSLNCKIIQEDGSGNPKVNCEVPYVKEIVDVYVRAHYDGDQKALSELASDSDNDVDVTLHEGHQVLSTAKLSALRKNKLLKRMHHD